MKKAIIVVGVLMFGLISSSAVAQNNRARIKQGVRNGEITVAEKAQIAKQQQDVRLAKQVAKADGVLSPNEKSIIIAEKKQVSKAIYRKKHNNRTRN